MEETMALLDTERAKQGFEPRLRVFDDDRDLFRPTALHVDSVSSISPGPRDPRSARGST